MSTGFPVLTRIINFPIFGEPGDDGRKITWQARDREAYASGLPVPHLAGLVYLVKIAANGFGLQLSEMSGTKRLNAWSCSS
jgi:hypothetical protein